MSSFWTGSKVRLRGIEPEDRPAFQRFDEHTADMVHPPRSAAGTAESPSATTTNGAATPPTPSCCC